MERTLARVCFAGERDILLGFADSPPPRDLRAGGRVVMGGLPPEGSASFLTAVDLCNIVACPPDILSCCSTSERLCPNACAKTSSRFLPRPPALTLSPDDNRFSNCGLCLAKLALVGDANDGLCVRVCVLSLRTGIRLGVPVASTGTDILGDILRRLEGEDSIRNMSIVLCVHHVRPMSYCFNKS